MKKFFILAASFAVTLGAMASKPASYVYTGQVSGVVCNACSSVVKESLMKLPGVQAVKITLARQGDAPRLTIISESPDLTLAQAIRALGAASSHYHIESLVRASETR